MGSPAAARALNQGADVIFGAGGKTGNGAVIEVASQEGAALCIGVDSDQWETVPEAHACPHLQHNETHHPGVYVRARLKPPARGSFPQATTLVVPVWPPYPTILTLRFLEKIKSPRLTLA